MKTQYTKMKRYIPENSKEIMREGIQAIVYTYEGHDGSIYALGYSGKRSRADFHFRYKNIEKRNLAINKFFDQIESAAQRRIQRKDELSKEKATLLKSIKIGAILYTSWGYEQTNVEWYQVTRLKGSSIWLRQITSDVTETSFMSGRSLPMKDNFVGEEFKRIVRSRAIRIDDVVAAYFWDGTPKHCSWYA